MMEEKLTQRIIDLMQREVVPAVGCTEPAAVALCVARAAELLGCRPEKLDVALSANMLKNAMGVGIPGTGMTGLPIAIALGALCGRSDDGLEVLARVTPEDVERGKEYIATGAISIRLATDAPSVLHIDVRAEGQGRTSRAVISESHTNIVFEVADGTTLQDKRTVGKHAGASADSGPETDAGPELTLKQVWDFATTTPLERIAFIARAAQLNINAADQAFRHSYGHSLGRIVAGPGKKFFGDTPVAHMISYTSAACDARMGGCPVAVMSNSGSGNQGITCTMPVVAAAEHLGKSEEETIRAAAVSNLLTIFVKTHYDVNYGRMAPVCCAAVAAGGAGAGVGYLLGMEAEELAMVLQNILGAVSGLFCDGAKSNCALKVSMALQGAMQSVILASQGCAANEFDGIVGRTVEDTIRNFFLIQKEGMPNIEDVLCRIEAEKEEVC